MQSKTVIGIGLLVAVIVALMTAAPVYPEGGPSKNPAPPKIWPDVTPGPYPVGYKIIQEYDNTRTFKTKYDYFGNPTPGPIARPIQISVWYPAEPSPDPAYMKLIEYFQDRSTETDFAPPTDEQRRFLVERLKQIWPIEFRTPPELRGALRQRIDSLLQENTVAIRDALPAKGPFPLIVHLPGYNGSPDGSSEFFEYLASFGYVVAVIPNMEVHTRNIDNEPASLDIQARDLEFAVARMIDFPSVDSSRIGTSGMSWGGMSNVLFAERNARVDAVLTLDGAITMPEELKLIEAVPGYAHKNMRAAYMQLLVTPAEAKFRPKDLRFWDSLEYCDAYMTQFRGVDHDEFSCGYLRLRNLKETDPERIAYLERFTREIYSEARQFFDAYLKNDPAARQSLAGSFGNAASADSMVALRAFKKAKPSPLTRREFLDIITTQGADEAAKIYAAYCKIQPRNNLIVSESIGPLFMDAFDCGNLKEALAICNLWESGMPDNPGPLFSKARIYTKTGEVGKAISCYEKILAMNPPEEQAATARKRIKELKAGPASGP